MNTRSVLALASIFCLLSGPLDASDGPLLFEGPPMPRNAPADVELSVYQQVSPFQVEEPPPVPVPIDEPEEVEGSAGSKITTDSERSPFAPPVPDVPVDSPDPMKDADGPFAPKDNSADPFAPTDDPFDPSPVPEIPAESPLRPEKPVEPPLRSEIPAEPDEPAEEPLQIRQVPLAPPISAETEEAAPLPEIPGGPAPSPDPMVDATPRESSSDHEGPTCTCRRCCPPTRCFRLPAISCADLALPTLPQPYVFDEFGVELGGWVEAGFSAVGTSPADRFNGPVTFNDRHAEGQMNQLWFYLERQPNTWACSLDLGGRIDVMYGTDAQFIQASDGLEANWEQSERFYRTALPQFYLDATLAGWAVRMGRFFTILGYEGPAAPDNFFYSHAYTMQYGEPFTHTGMLVSRRFGNWLLNAGFHRGNDQFDDTDGLNALNLLGGIGYKAPGDLATVEYAFSSTENGPGVLSYTHSMVNTVQVTEKLEYVLQGDYGQIWNETFRRKASWWGLNQYLTYTFNPCWAAAVRVEWFRDRDGNQVSGIRAGNQTPRRLAGDFYEITLGLNWKPRSNLRVRPEVRWDIFDPGPSTTNQAYDAGNLNRQFTFGCDVIYTF